MHLLCPQERMYVQRPPQVAGSSNPHLPRPGPRSCPGPLRHRQPVLSALFEHRRWLVPTLKVVCSDRNDIAARAYRGARSAPAQAVVALARGLARAANARAEAAVGMPTTSPPRITSSKASQASPSRAGTGARRARDGVSAPPSTARAWDPASRPESARANEQPHTSAFGDDA